MPSLMLTTLLLYLQMQISSKVETLSKVEGCDLLRVGINVKLNDATEVLVLTSHLACFGLWKPENCIRAVINVNC